METALPDAAAGRFQFDNDKPINEIDRDLFGFGAIAEKLADAVLSMGSKEGFVIGIEGVWGSGKSSLMNLLVQQVQKDDSATVINFAPWLVGDRNELISALMSDIAAELDRIQDAADPTHKAKSGGKDLAAKLRAYGVRTGKGLGPLLQLASMAVPGLGAVATGVEHLTGALEAVGDTQTPLPALKAEISALLAKLGRRFVVVIDDLDRLEPKEATEIIRLVRAVGDFPNVVYVLCYDRGILATSINHALQIADGDRYLQKIVQATYAIPQPEDTELRHWLFEETQAFYHEVTKSTLVGDDLERLRDTVFGRGELLRTPRDVIQVMNALRLIYPAVHKDVDFADICWLQIIRVSQRELYNWIETYLTQVSLVALGDGSIETAARDRLAVQLEELLPDEGYGLNAVWSITDHLPGVSGGHRDGGEHRIFNEINSLTMSNFENSRRLGSPSHYRYYFSFTPARNAFSDDQLNKVIELASGELDALVAHLRGLIDTPRRYGGTWYAQFQRRLIRRGFNGVSLTAIRNITMAIATVIDSAQAVAPDRGLSGYDNTWDDGRRLLKEALDALNDNDRNALLLTIVNFTPSLGWLIGEVVGGEMYRHGRMDGRNGYPENQRVLTSGELDTALAMLRERLAHAETLERLHETPRLLNVLYRWEEIAESDDPIRSWLADRQRTDANFVQIMHSLRGWLMSDRVYYPLNRRDVGRFMDYDAAIARLRGLADNPDETGAKARELLEAAAIGDRR